MTTVELTLKVQRRGCRPLDRAEDVEHAIRSVLQYHRRPFRKDDKGRWEVAENSTKAN